MASLFKQPSARANIRGNELYPDIKGMIKFYQTGFGVIVSVQLSELPENSVLGFHIHDGDNCKELSTHYNPRNDLHPYHAGDLPPVFSAGGYAFSAVLTNRFTVNEIVGRTVILHGLPDDFTTQPSGKSGEKIACGVIDRVAGRYPYNFD
ncbi:MAG: superoxide dismutase family protein [Ruminococcaceae bacterium]|nr:superoxide dismutase family protein [Oscillospiraceae bacterium]